MANPFFNATYYNQNNPDVFVSGMNPYDHYVQYGANEALQGAASRKPAPWFDITYYFDNNPDLVAANLTAAQLFEHFTTYGFKEGRAPNPVAAETVNADSLLAYALANPDLLEAFGIDADATDLTADQLVDVAGHYYAYGYNEARPALPATEFEDEVVDTDHELTVGRDVITVEGNNNDIYAPVVQNMLGAVTNTLETGDIISGETGSVGNTLIADLALTVSGTVPVGPAISAQTNNIDHVVLRAQTGNADFVGADQGNVSHIDAENFNGVKTWFSDNSRASIQVEDVRTKPEDTTIGLSNSDPFVGFRVYFDPQQLQNTVRNQDSALTLRIENAQGNLEDVPVDGLTFSLGGESYSVRSEAMGQATTQAEFAEALEAELALTPELAGIKVTVNADNTITLLDPAGNAFATGSWNFINNEIPADADITIRQEIGEPESVEELISTNIVLDNVGRTSQGGIVDVGSLGDGGIQEFNVEVGASSWVSSLESNSYLGNYYGDAFLEVVNVAHAAGAKGNLTVGFETVTTDDRVVAGLWDVRELNAAGFTGDLKAGIVLTNNVSERYLEDADEVVNFNYTTGSGNDNLTIEVDEDIASDPDFALNVDLAAGDDRLNLDLNGGDANKVSVNGGAGHNTIEVTSNHGINASNTFANFENFQTYVVAGGGSSHKFDSMAGVEQVVVATTIDANTTLENLEADTAVSISGKNQTIANGASNEDQLFSTVTVTNAAGAALNVSLDNTARLDGVLDVASLVIDGADSAVRTLNLASNGKRDTTNIIDEVNAAKVNTFNITGTQDIVVAIDAAANSTAAAAARGNFTVDASKLDASIALGVDAAVATAIDGTDGRVNTFKGAAGAKDTLWFVGEAALETTQHTSVSGFETVNFDVEGNSVKFNATNVSGVSTYNLINTGAAELTKLSDGINVTINAFDDFEAVSGSVDLFGAGNAINVALVGDTVGSWGNDSLADSLALNVAGYTTVNLDLAGWTKENQKNFDFNFELKLQEDLATASVARELILTGGDAKDAPQSSSVVLENLNTGLTLVDLTAYAGKVTGSFATNGSDPESVQPFVADKVIKVGASEIDWTVTQVGVNPQQQYNTIFKFTESTGKAGDDKSAWVINDFLATGGLGVNADTKTMLDLSDLGITAYTQLSIIVIDQDEGEYTITADIPTAQQTWEIQLIGAVVGDAGITADNFIFA